MKKVQLGEIADVIAGQSPPSKTYNSAKDGLPFFQGKADFQEKYPKVRMWCNSEKRKEAEPEDILISVRAPVGSVNLCDRLSIIGRGLSAIRPRSGIHADYLYYFFKKNEDRIANLGSGSTFKSITQDILKKIKVPVPYKNGSPDLDDQTRIATLLYKVESLIAKRKKSIADLDELLKSTFLEMFGDPVRNEMGWDEKYLNKLGTIERGVSKHRPRNAPELLVGNYPLIQTGDVANSGTFINRYNQTYSDLGLKQSKLWPKGTLCITIAANIAKTGILNFDACFPDSVVGFQAEKKYSVYYVHFLFAFLQDILEKKAPHAAQKNINLKILKSLKVPAPPYNLQIKFATIVEKVETLKKKYQNSLNDLETLYGALSQKAFKGELDLSRIPITLELKPKDITTVEPQLGKPDLTVQDEPDKTPETREQILHRLFNRFISDAKNGTLSLDDFWLEAEEKLMDLLDEDAPPLGMADYNRVRDWLFDMLAQGKVAQMFNEQENRMEIRSVP